MTDSSDPAAHGGAAEPDRRLTLEMKCAGLDAEVMACRSATPDPAVVADAWSTWRAEVAFGPRRPVAGRP
jgi:hypothetical protein